MITHVEEMTHGKILEVHLTGKLSRDDYAKFVPDSEDMIDRFGKIRILVVLDDFHGWEVGALWEDIKWDARHATDVERIAIVGETKWHQWMASFCKPFTSANLRYFGHDRLTEARAWLEAA
jgi:hypothetical protein